MSVIDNLQVLITADARGIDSVLKRTLQTVTGTVNQINKQEVDWTSIFTRSVSPAVIGAVASVFAFAISNAIQFQSALNQLGTAAGDNAAQIGQLGQSALGLSTVVPSSAQDIASAMAQVSGIFSDVNDQQAVVAAMAQLAASGFGSLGDIVGASVNIFKTWGVTTKDQAIAVLTQLMHGAETAKESIPALAAQFEQFSPSLIEAGANLSSFNGLISTFSSEIKNIGVKGTGEIFQSLSDSANNVVGPMELLGISIAKVRQSLLQDGGLSAITQTSQALAKMGPTANLVATAFGFSKDQIAAFDLNAQRLPQIAKDALATAQNSQTIGDAYKQSDSALRQLEISWNIFKASLIPIADILLKGINHWISGDWLNPVSDKIRSFFASMGIDIGAVIRNMGTMFTTGIVDAIKGGWNLGASFLKASALVLTFSFGNLMDILGKVVKAIQSAMTDVINKINTDIQSIVNKVSATLGGITSKIDSQIASTTSKLQSASNSVYNKLSNVTTQLGATVQGKYYSSNPQQEAIAEALYKSGAGFTTPMIQKIENQASGSGLLQQLLNALSQNMSGSSTSFAQLKNTFNISTSAGHTYSTAQDIAKQLYQQFQGVQ